MNLLTKINFPLAAPSANPFGYISPTTASHVKKQLNGSIPMVLQGGACKIGIESTIVGMEHGTLVVYRFGGLPIEEIAAQLPSLKILSAQKASKMLPGGLLSHYAPHKKLLLFDNRALLEDAILAMPNSSVIYFGNHLKTIAPIAHNLSKVEDLYEAAARLFDILHQADDDDTEIILAERVPQVGIGIAINDRLHRASYKEPF